MRDSMGDPAKKRILVVEDEAHLAEGLKLNLTLKGYDVMIAGREVRLCGSGRNGSRT